MMDEEIVGLFIPGDEPSGPDDRWRGKRIAGSRPSGRSLFGNAIVARVARLGAGAPLSLGDSESAAPYITTRGGVGAVSYHGGMPLRAMPRVGPGDHRLRGVDHRRDRAARRRGRRPAVGPDGGGNGADVHAQAGDELGSPRAVRPVRGCGRSLAE
jgi:hypothetical protein